MKQRIVFSILVVMGFVSTGCFKKPDKDKMAQSVSMSVIPIYNGSTGSFLSSGSSSCSGNTSVLFTYSSALTATNTVEATCNNDSVGSVSLPVSSGDTAQVFSVQIIGKMQSKKSTPTVLSVNFSPLPNPVAGSAVTIGGGAATSAGSSTYSVLGEVYAGQLQTGAPGIARSGLSGVLDP